MAWQNNLREIQIILYRLKRNFGLPAVLKVPVTTTQNVTTGAIVRTYTDYTINRMILLPSRSLRDFVYDLSYIAANKNFTYGAMFDSRARTIIIDAHDLPTDFEMNTTYHVVFDSRRYEIKEFTLAENHQGWILTVIELDSSDSES